MIAGGEAREEGGGGDRGGRTPNLGIANAALSQLSYVPTAAPIRRWADRSISIVGRAVAGCQVGDEE